MAVRPLPIVTQSWLVVGLLAHSVAAGGMWGKAAAAESRVLTVLGQAEFDRVLANSTLVLADFMAPWCGHCKRLNPELDQASMELRHISELSIIKIDCTEAENAELRKAHAVTHFPTLIVMEHSRASRYSGARSADALVQFLRKRSEPAVITISAGLPDQLAGGLRGAVLATGLSPEQAREFRVVASRLRDRHAFMLVENDEFAARIGLKPGRVSGFKGPVWEPTTLLNSTSLLPGPIVQGRSDLEAWVEVELSPPLIRLTPNNREDYGFAESKLARAMLFTGAQGLLDADLVEQIHELARKFKNQIRFGEVPADNKALADKYGVLPGSGSVMMVEYGESKFKCAVVGDKSLEKQMDNRETNGIPTANLSQCLQDLLDHKLEPYHKSADDDHELTYNNFNQFRAHGRPAIVLFYNPRTKGYRRVEPIFQELLATLAGEPMVMVEQYNIVSNDPPPGVPLVTSFTGWETQNQLILLPATIKDGQGEGWRLPQTSSVVDIIEQVQERLGVQDLKLQWPTLTERATRQLVKYKAVFGVLVVAGVCVIIMVYAFNTDNKGTAKSRYKSYKQPDGEGAVVETADTRQQVPNPEKKDPEPESKKEL